MKYPYQNTSLEDLKGEKWEDLPWLDGMYCISNFGRIKRESFEIQCRNGQIRKMQPKILAIEVTKQKNNTVGDFQYFLRSSITTDGITYKLSIARLIYYCFIRKFNLDNHFLVVLAIDGNGKNIHPKNLALVDLSRKQKRIFERNRLKRQIITSFEEFQRAGKIKSANPYCKQVSQYTLNGKKIQTFPSIKAGSIATGISDRNIVQALKDRQLSSGGFVWRYGKSAHTDIKTLRAEHLKNFKKLVGQKVSKYTLQGKRVATYLTISDAARATNTQVGDICAVLKGKQRSAGGFIWKKGYGRKQINVQGYLTGIEWRAQKRHKKIKQFDLQGKYIQTFESVKAAAQFLNVTPSYISLVTNKKVPLRQFFWRASSRI